MITFGTPDPLMEELKAAAFEYLLLNPGSEFGDWQQGLIEEYPTEVVDALSNNPVRYTQTSPTFGKATMRTQRPA